MRKDKAVKRFFRKNERFADLINGALYQGKQVVLADDLEEVDTELSEKIKHQTEHRRRDLMKRCKTDGTAYILYGTEFQSTVDQMMPVRIMEYDALTYLKMHEQEKKVHPVVTVCLYTGEKIWNQPVSLHEMMEISDELKEVVQDYRIHVIEAKDQQIEKYQNREVSEFFELMHDCYTLNRNELQSKYSEREMSSAEAIECASILADSEEIGKMVITDKEGNKMCQNLKNIFNEIRDEGRLVGLEEGKTEGYIKNTYDVVKRLKEAEMSVETMMIATGLSYTEVQNIIACC